MAIWMMWWSSKKEVSLWSKTLRQISGSDLSRDIFTCKNSFMARSFSKCNQICLCGNKSEELNQPNCFGSLSHRELLGTGVNFQIARICEHERNFCWLSLSRIQAIIGSRHECGLVFCPSAGTHLVMPSQSQSMASYCRHLQPLLLAGRLRVGLDVYWNHLHPRYTPVTWRFSLWRYLQGDDCAVHFHWRNSE